MPERILPPYSVPLTDKDGKITQEWRHALDDVFDQLFNAGEQLAIQASQLNILEQDVRTLEELVSSLQANVENPLPPTQAISDAPVGSIVAFAGDELPLGWLVCDGSDVSRSEYSMLFDAIGETWGPGDGSTTFTLPDGRGRMFLGDDGSTSVGDYGGSAGSTDLEHNHDVTIPSTEVQSGTGATVGQAGTFTTTAELAGVSSIPPFFIGTWIIRY